MQPDPQRLADTRAWLTRADADLRAARLDLSGEPPLTGDAVFHCQQAAEKALKAFLPWHDQPFRRTHNLVEIGQQCTAIEPSLDPLARRAALLSEYAWRYHYPGEGDEPTPAEAEEALALARQTRATIVGLLGIGT